MTTKTEYFGDAPASDWRCPVPEHHDPDHPRRRFTQDTEWVAGVGICLFPGCMRSSLGGPPECQCDGYDCEGECCGIGNCTCSADAEEEL